MAGPRWAHIHLHMHRYIYTMHRVVHAVCIHNLKLVIIGVQLNCIHVHVCGMNAKAIRYSQLDLHTDSTVHVLHKYVELLRSVTSQK